MITIKPYQRWLKPKKDCVPDGYIVFQRLCDGLSIYYVPAYADGLAIVSKIKQYAQYSLEPDYWE